MADLVLHMNSINKGVKGITESNKNLTPREDLRVFAKRNADMSLLCNAIDKCKTTDPVMNSVSDHVFKEAAINTEDYISLLAKVSNDLISFGYDSQCYIPTSSVGSDKTMSVKLPLAVHVKDMEAFSTYGIISKLPLGCSISCFDLSYDTVCASLRPLTNDASRSCITIKLFVSIVLLFAKQHKLVGLTGGFLSVSALLHLIVHFLLNKRLARIDNSFSSRIIYKFNSDGELIGDVIESCDPIILFHKFCHYYSFEFNIFDDVVSITTDENMHKSSKSQYLSCVMWRLYIEDISNSSVDLSSCLTRPGQIQLFKAFRRGTFATLRILEFMKSQVPDATNLIPHLFDNRMLDLAISGGYNGVKITNVPILNQLIHHQSTSDTIYCQSYLPLEETTTKKAHTETKLIGHKEKGGNNHTIVGASSVFTNFVTSRYPVINIDSSLDMDSASISKNVPIRTKPFIPKLAISETASVADPFGKAIHNAPVFLNVGFEPGSGHTDRSFSSASSRSDADLSSARSLNEFNSIIDHLTSTAALLSDNMSGQKSARGIDTPSIPNNSGSTATSTVVETVSRTAASGRDSKRVPRLVHWASKSK